MHTELDGVNSSFIDACIRDWKTLVGAVLCIREQVYQLLIGFRYLGLICQRRKKCRLSSAILQVMTIKKVFNFTSCGAANQLRNTVKVIYSCELGGESLQK